MSSGRSTYLLRFADDGRDGDGAGVLDSRRDPDAEDVIDCNNNCRDASRSSATYAEAPAAVPGRAPTEEEIAGLAAVAAMTVQVAVSSRSSESS